MSSLQRNQIDDELGKALVGLEECGKALQSKDVQKAKLALAEAVEKLQRLRRDI